MNRAGMATAVYNRVGVPSTDGQLTAGVVGQLVNDANHMIEVMSDWPWLARSVPITTIPGTDTYATPADWLRSDELLILTSSGPAVRMGKSSGQEFDDAYWSNVTGMPRGWIVRGDQIVMRPVPDAVYTVTHLYYRQEPDLDGDTDTPLMPSSFHAAIVELASSLCLRRVQQEGRAAVAEAAFTQQWMPRLQQHRRRASGPLRVRVRGGYMGPN